MYGPVMKTGQVFNLSTLGIDPKFFKFNVTQMESEKYISIRDVDAVYSRVSLVWCWSAHHYRCTERNVRQ
jgi:hypothetical protein